MKELTGSILPITAVWFILLLTILVVNISIYVNMEHKLMSRFFHIVSFFWFVCFFCLLMQTVLLDLSIEEYYRVIGTVSGWLGFFVGILLLGLKLTVFRKETINPFRQPDYRTVLSKLDELIVFNDYTGKIIETNTAFARHEALKKVGSIAELCHILQTENEHMEPHIREDWLKHPERPKQIEINLLDNTYAVYGNPLHMRGGRPLGHVNVFHQVTEEKLLRDQLALQNGRMEEVNGQLLEYVGTAEVLESEKVRLLLLTKVREDLIKNIEEIIRTIGSLEVNEEVSVDEKKVELSKVADRLRLSLKTIRFSVKTMTNQL